MVSVSESGGKSLAVQDKTGIFIHMAAELVVTAEATSDVGTAAETTPSIKKENLS